MPLNNGYKPSESLGYLTGLAGRLFNQLLTQRFLEAGIHMTAEQWGIVLVLLNNNALTQGQLGELLYLDKSSVSRAMRGLEKRGWVECRKCAEDARQKRVVLTPGAIDVAARCSAIAKGVLADAQAGLDAGAVAASLQHLAGVVANLRALTQS